MDYGERRRRGGGGRKFMGGCCGLVMICVIVLLVRLQIASRPPLVNIPSPTMPSPNAFDFYRSAGKQLIDDKKIGDAIFSRPTTAYTLTDKEKFVSENAPALQTLHQGFAYEYKNPPARSYTAAFPYYAQFRSVARLLMLEAQVKAQKGDWSGAVNSNLDAVQMGEEIPHGSVLIGDLVGIACQAIGRRNIWDEVDHLNAAQARKATKRLEAITARHLPFAEVLQEEKWFGQGGLQEIFRQKNGLQQLMNSANGQANASGTGQPDWTQLVWLVYSKERVMADYSHYMDQMIASNRPSYGARLPDPPLPNDPICQILCPVYALARFRNAFNETQNQLLLVTLALRAYRVEHGAYPAALNQLVPGYLSKLPEDPFTKQGPFAYRQSGEKYTLYSVGPDGVDNGGKPVDDPSKATQTSPRARYMVDVNSKGDIVVGVNMQ